MRKKNEKLWNLLVKSNAVAMCCLIPNSIEELDPQKSTHY